MATRRYHTDRGRGVDGGASAFEVVPLAKPIGIFARPLNGRARPAGAQPAEVRVWDDNGGREATDHPWYPRLSYAPKAMLEHMATNLNSGPYSQTNQPSATVFVFNNLRSQFAFLSDPTA